MGRSGGYSRSLAVLLLASPLARGAHATHIETEKSGHYLRVFEPELVVNAISNIVAGVRSRASAGGK